MSLLLDMPRSFTSGLNCCRQRVGQNMLAAMLMVKARMAVLNPNDKID